jgi:hypothetical protein
MLESLSLSRRRALLALVLAAGLAALFAVLNPGSANSAPLTVTVLGQTSETPPASCPGKIVNEVEVTPCRVEGHVTGFQSIAGGIARPYEAPYEGKIVAWSITLAKPSTTETATTTNEVGFFNEFLGEPSEARIGILKPVEGTNPPQYTLVRQSPLQVLNPYFGTTPVFAFNVSSENTWRGSRLPEHCSSKEDIQEGNPQQGVGKTKTYGCYYSNARLLYTATLVKNPKAAE